MGRRIGGAGGGSDKGSGSGRFVVGAVAAVAIASAGGGVGAGTVGGSSTGSAVESVTGRNITAKKADGQRAARRGNADQAWRRMGLRGVKKAVKQDLTCIANSFGQVREFFVRNPCKSLDRILFGIDDGSGNLIVVSVAWVGFRSRGDARRFQDLDDVYGTGNVSPLGGALLGLAEVRFTGQHYQSRVVGAVAVIAEAEAAIGSVEDGVLDTVAEVAVLLPRP